MPEMGESVTEGTVLEWHVSVGDVVEEVEILRKTRAIVRTMQDGGTCQIAFRATAGRPDPEHARL